MLAQTHKLYLTAYYYRRPFAFMALAGLWLWVVSPGDDQIDPVKCEAKGFPAVLSAKIHGEGFWRAQLASLRASISRAEGNYARLKHSEAIEEAEAAEFFKRRAVAAKNCEMAILTGTTAFPVSAQVKQ